MVTSRKGFETNATLTSKKTQQVREKKCDGGKKGSVGRGGPYRRLGGSSVPIKGYKKKKKKKT